MSAHKKKFLITSALPYANGPLHFGHLAGVYIPADIYTRHRRLQGHTVKHISGSDEHGVAIMLAAEKEGLDYRSYVDRWHKSHKELFQKYDVDFDFFGRTSERYHEEEVLLWFHALYKDGLIDKKTEKQLYCIDDKRFLPDRYVEGTCYVCGYAQARGDECPNCGTWIEAIKLINPVSKMSGSRNIEVRDVEHYYLMLTKMETQFREWFDSKSGWKNLVRGFVNGLLQSGTIDRAISRDLDWGIDVPLPEAKGKKLYVWFDAPIGYVSNTKQHLAEVGEGEDYLRDWWMNPDVEISHFIGKDNIIFHAYIWPCMIMGTKRIRLPDEIPANEFVNLEGKQFSKSSGWYVDSERAIAQFGVDMLRFYLCSLIPETGDTSFSWDDFSAVSGEFANKVGNFVHRTLSFMDKNFPDGLGPESFAGVESSASTRGIAEGLVRVVGELDHFHFGKAQAEILALSQLANEYFHGQAPWQVIKTDRAATAATLAQSLVYIAALGVILRPLTPTLAERLLGHFEGYMTPEMARDIYAGRVGGLVAEFQSRGFRNPRPSEALIPRLDPKVVQVWKDELIAK